MKIEYWMCPICNQTFKEYKKYREHMKRGHKVKVWISRRENKYEQTV